MDKVSSDFDNMVNDNFGWLRTNKYVLPVIALFLILYVTSVRPKLPKFIEDLFENPVFRLVVIAYIVYRANSDMQSAILIAALFLIVMHLINKNKAEGFSTTVGQCQEGCMCQRTDANDGKMSLFCGRNRAGTTLLGNCQAINVTCRDGKVQGPAQTQQQRARAQAASTPVPTTPAPVMRAVAQVSNAVATPRATADPCANQCACMRAGKVRGRDVFKLACDKPECENKFRPCTALGAPVRA
jgi:hypothetical protein